MKNLRTIGTSLLIGMMMAGLAFAGQPVDINSANAQTLADSLDGVGLSKAQAIVSYRESNGAFKHADELVNVRGIGLATVDKNRDNIKLKPVNQTAKRD